MRKALTVFLVMLSVAALYLGPKWNAVSQKTPGVTVHFRDGSIATGEFSRTWAGDYQLAMQDGAQIIFREFRMIEIDAGKRDNSSAMLANWRMVLPVAGVGCLMFVFIGRQIFALTPDRRSIA